jgi:hypothetical protein
MFLDAIYGLFSHDLAIDLGTANTLVYVHGKGMVCSEPSVVAVTTDPNGRGERVLAVGFEAKEMLGRTPGDVRAIRPIKDGVIADFEITEAMLRYFIQRAHNRGKLIRPRIVICVPPCITSVEKRAVRESPDRGADGGRNRCRPRRHGAHRKHGGRHRRRHDRRGGHLALRHRHIQLDPLRRRQDGRGDHQLRQAQVQHADR